MLFSYIVSRCALNFIVTCYIISDSAAPWTAGSQASLSFTITRACSNSCPLSWWSHPTISSSVVSFSSCLQTFLASRSFPMSWLFALGGQSIGASVSASVFPMNIQGWFPLGLIGLISLQYKGLARVVSGTTIKGINSSPFNLLYGPNLTSIHGWLEKS